MSKKTIENTYLKAEKNGVSLECTCVEIKYKEWEELMKNHQKGDRKRIEQILLANELIQRKETSTIYTEKQVRYYVTETHLIRVWKEIEEFYKIK